MKISNDRFVRECLEEATVGVRYGATVSMFAALENAPEMTPIEQVMYLFLVQLSFILNLWNKPTTISPQAKVGEYRADFVVTCCGKKFVIECDGHDYHEKTKEQEQRDKKRDRDMQLLGFDVYRFSGSEIWKDFSWQDTVKDIFTKYDVERPQNE